jgi:hypothetical protein
MNDSPRFKGSCSLVDTSTVTAGRDRYHSLIGPWHPYRPRAYTAGSPYEMRRDICSLGSDVIML